MPIDGTVYVIDDDPAMRESLDFLLGTTGFPVLTFDSAASFLQVLSTIQSGCVLTDVRMPEIDGLELLRRVKMSAIKLPVVVMTGHGDIALAVEAMKLGASDFLEKPFDDDLLITTIRASLERGAHQMKADAKAEEIVKRVETLSLRERQVMDGILAGHSNKIIAREYDISPRTVEVYRAHVMTKMNAQNFPDLVRLAFRAGILRN